MPRIIDYLTVLQTLEAQGFRCLYHNSGAFGFAPGARLEHVGWIGKPDSTIRESARAFVRQVDEPFVPNLVDRATQQWQEQLLGNVWAMPKSHWSYELEFGNAQWLPEALRSIGIDSEQLKSRNNGAAIEFAASETAEFRCFLQQLLENLHGSDFLLAFPGRGTVCTVHHHQQLWWQSVVHE